MPSSSPPPTPPQHTPPLTDLYLPPTGAHQRSTHANDPHTNTKISAVRQRLSARLPDYMVPAQIVVLDEFPLTSSGKIDRKALPAPVFAATPFRAPQTQTEEIVAGIYAQVLGLERVGVDDSFFDLGGDSILSMQVVARARAAGVLCRPRDIFVEQTVAGLARVAGVTDGAGGVIDEGVGPVVATPIMCWLQGVDGPVDAVQPDDDGAGPGGGDRGRCGGGVAGVAGSACHAAAARRGRWRRRLVVAGARGGVGGCAAGACTRWTCYPMRRWWGHGRG